MLADEQQQPAIATRIERVFDEIARARMAGLPFVNAALRVQVVGVRRWQSRAGEVWLCVLITPWAINLMVLPCAAPGWHLPSSGYSQSWSFPSGDYEFLGANEPGLGEYLSCSLFSPTFELTDQQQAVDTASAVLNALFVQETPLSRGAGEGVASATPVASISRRTFLRGGLP